jgi:putative two-component system response regulator
MGLPDDEVEVIRRAAPLHDIGKIGIADSILLKPGRLRPDEEEIMKTHTLIGEQILGGSESQLLRAAQQIAGTHHERWDGRGYPAGLRGAEIPLWARIFAVVDTVDAITSDRPDRAARSLEVAIEELRAGCGAQFDPDCVDAFERLDRQAIDRLLQHRDEPHGEIDQIAMPEFSLKSHAG